MKSMKIYTLLPVLLLALLSSVVNAEGLLVVASPNCPVDSLDQHTVRNIFLSREKFFPDSSEKVSPIDLPADNEAYATFYERTANMSPKSLSRYRARVIFSGKGQMPQQAKSLEEVRQILKINDYAIAYMPEGSDIKDLKLLLTLE